VIDLAIVFPQACLGQRIEQAFQDVIKIPFATVWWTNKKHQTELVLQG
jgi:hypothetical protein